MKTKTHDCSKCASEDSMYPIKVWKWKKDAWYPVEQCVACGWEQFA